MISNNRGKLWFETEWVKEQCNNEIVISVLEKSWTLAFLLWYFHTSGKHSFPRVSALFWREPREECSRCLDSAVCFVFLHFPFWITTFKQWPLFSVVTSGSTLLLSVTDQPTEKWKWGSSTNYSCSLYKWKANDVWYYTVTLKICCFHGSFCVLSQLRLNHSWPGCA